MHWLGHGLAGDHVVGDAPDARRLGWRLCPRRVPRAARGVDDGRRHRWWREQSRCLEATLFLLDTTRTISSVTSSTMAQISEIEGENRIVDV
jgi:hypothetical protein